MKKFMNLFMIPHKKVHEPYDMVHELPFVVHGLFMKMFMN